MAVGKIQQDGTYVLSTYERNGSDGAIVGRHRASIVPPLAEGEFDAPPAMTRPIPEKYQSEGTSLLVYEVKADTDNVIDIELSTKSND
jgi:hypothetical protein